MDIVVPCIQDEVNHKYFSSKKLSTILSFEQISYLINYYDLDSDKYMLEDWWKHNSGIDLEYEEFEEYEQYEGV